MIVNFKLIDSFTPRLEITGLPEHTSYLQKLPEALIDTYILKSHPYIAHNITVSFFDPQASNLRTLKSHSPEYEIFTEVFLNSIENAEKLGVISAFEFVRRWRFLLDFMSSHATSEYSFQMREKYFFGLFNIVVQYESNKERNFGVYRYVKDGVLGDYRFDGGIGGVRDVLGKALNQYFVELK